MTYSFCVRPHPLGVVVYQERGVPGELLLPGEDCCGIAFKDLERAAGKEGRVEVSDEAANSCPLLGRPR